MIKLIAADMDGTLLNSNHEISDENLKAIKFAKEKGIIFTIATGREYLSVKPVLDKYKLECQCIVMNGAEYRDIHGGIIDSIEIDKKYIKNIIDVLQEEGLCAEILTDGGLYVSNEELGNKAFKERKKLITSAMIQEEVDVFETQFKHLYNPKNIIDIDEFISSNIEVYKIMTFSLDKDVIKRARVKLKKIEDLSVESTYVTNVEITDATATKGKILVNVIKAMGIDKDEVMILGDSFNDYSMFEEFNNSFAMENAIPEVKEIAKYITDTNDNAGVAKAIYQMVK